VLGAATNLRPWADARRLPFFLTDSFEFAEVVLFGQPAVLAIDRGQSALTPSDIASRIKAVRTAAPRVAYVADRLAFRERRALIGLRVPFIVPGNQLYLPDLGIDLREYFRKPPAAPDNALSPATQAMLIAVLLRKPSPAKWQPAEVVSELGYSAMTLSRAVKELTAADIATLRTEGRARWLHKERTVAETWERAKPLLRSPVKRRFWARPVPKWKPPHVRLAGLSALARKA
jgi:hypothetical protein